MIARQITLALLLTVGIHQSTFAKEVTVRDNGKILFWQTGFTGGQGGACAIKFGFQAQDYSKAIDDITISFRAFARDGKDMGVHELRLQKLGGSHADEYAEATFMIEKWPNQERGLFSPLCDNKTRLVVEGAVGTQLGKTIDLKLKFTTFQKISVTVKKPGMPN